MFPRPQFLPQEHRRLHWASQILLGQYSVETRLMIFLAQEPYYSHVRGNSQKNSGLILFLRGRKDFDFITPSRPSILKNPSLSFPNEVGLYSGRWTCCSIRRNDNMSTCRCGVSTQGVMSPLFSPSLAAEAAIQTVEVTIWTIRKHSMKWPISLNTDMPLFYVVHISLSFQWRYFL